MPVDLVWRAVSLTRERKRPAHVGKKGGKTESRRSIERGKEVGEYRRK